MPGFQVDRPNAYIGKRGETGIIHQNSRMMGWENDGENGGQSIYCGIHSYDQHSQHFMGEGGVNRSSFGWYDILIEGVKAVF